MIHCYSTGKTSGAFYIGGLCGSILTGGSYEDTGNFWDTQTSQIATSAMGTGKTTAEMKMLSTFVNAGWDMINVWDIGEDQTYPFLRRHLPSDIDKDDETNLFDLAIFAQLWLEGI